MANIKLIVGLGNPGNNYATTRHNVGWWWLDQFSYQESVTLFPNAKFFSNYSKIKKSGENLHLVAPTTFMNLSGKSILAVTKFFQIKPEEILVVHDELDLEPGDIRYKKGGGHGGHNGLRDIISRLGTKDFYRLRIGIGHPGPKNKVESYVLNKPSKEDTDLINIAINKSLENIDMAISGQFQKVMNTLHQK